MCGVEVMKGVPLYRRIGLQMDLAQSGKEGADGSKPSKWPEVPYFWECNSNTLHQCCEYTKKLDEHTDFSSDQEWP